CPGWLSLLDELHAGVIPEIIDRYLPHRLQLFLSFGGGSAHRHCHLHSGSIQGTESDPKSLCPCRKTSLFENRIKNSGKRPSWALLSSCTSFFPMLLYRRNKDLSKSGVSGIPC